MCIVLRFCCCRSEVGCGGTLKSFSTDVGTCSAREPALFFYTFPLLLVVPLRSVGPSMGGRTATGRPRVFSHFASFSCSRVIEGALLPPFSRESTQRLRGPTATCFGFPSCKRTKDGGEKGDAIPRVFRRKMTRGFPLPLKSRTLLR